MSYKIGDYVVINDSLARISEQENYCGVPIEDTWCLSYLCGVRNPLIVSGNQLRPAVLSDWAIEIPEKYRDDTGGGGYIILVNFDEIKHIKMLYYMDNKLYEVNDYTYFEADAISAHYGIPIMPYEKYEEYMKRK